MAQQWVTSAWTEILVLLLLAFDICVETYALASNFADGAIDDGSLGPAEDPVFTATGVVLIVFTYETFVRVFGFRCALIDGSRILDSVDALIILVSVLTFLVSLAGVLGSGSRIFNALRLLRLLRIVRFARGLRKLVGANKRRYQKDGFDLDLTYVTPTCIAMSLPAEGHEANFRNPLDDVARFFNTKHPDAYCIFNLCAEVQTPAYLPPWLLASAASCLLWLLLEVFPQSCTRLPVPDCLVAPALSGPTILPCLAVALFVS
jgi:hypothetical protein